MVQKKTARALRPSPCFSGSGNYPCVSGFLRNSVAAGLACNAPSQWPGEFQLPLALSSGYPVESFDVYFLRSSHSARHHRWNGALGREVQKLGEHLALLFWEFFRTQCFRDISSRCDRSLSKSESVMISLEPIFRSPLRSPGKGWAPEFPQRLSLSDALNPRGCRYLARWCRT